MTDLRKALGDPFLTGHSGCPEGPHVKLAYPTVAEAIDAHDALMAFLATKRRLPFHMDPDAQAAVLADLPESIAQEAGEFYENAGAGQRKPLKKREAMAVAWQSVLRPYLIGLRDQHALQSRPATARRRTKR